MIDKIIETLKLNENHKNSLIIDTFFYDFLLEYCPNYGLICDSSAYEEYFKKIKNLFLKPQN